MNDSGKVLSAGVNSFPTGVDDSPSYRWVRPTKYNYVVHAELNAIAEAASSGVSLRGATCIQTLFPCISCTKAIIQVGIRKICVPRIGRSLLWEEEWHFSKEMLDETGVDIEYVDEQT